ncbi:hypothetical protein E1301_Tti023968 [Triplophysa tibetana]|uniref:Uncharacterized protein n=1 Tax=Triplophysa tibetana TaxID=1572043 RepID=A0A5A9NTQ5_9TELE|nr:hypothetical protein E1301_Tti023968 [Triplophysa tibetana]
MYLLDGSYPERMERGTPQRKTVYRISLTLVKKENLEDSGSPAHRRLENPKVSAYRREASCEIPRSSPLEELKEVDDETDEFSSHSYMRNFRTFSTGHLELGRLKISKRTQALNEKCVLPEHAQKKLNENGALVYKKNIQAKEMEQSNVKCTEISGTDAGNGENQGYTKILKTSRSTEEPVCMWSDETRASEEAESVRTAKESCISTLLAKGNGKTPKPAPETPPVKRHPSLLRRSFSFRHWTGGELIRIRALSKEKHHSSSGCIGRDGEENQAQSSTVLQNPAFETESEKRNTLDVGEVLSKTDSMTELGRRDRAKGKNRTLDNSDLFKLTEKSLVEKEGFIRGTGFRSSGHERKLIRFFSGIFSKRDGTSTPLRSPSNQALRKNGLLGSYRRSDTGFSQSSTESVNGCLPDGNRSCYFFPLVFVSDVKRQGDALFAVVDPGRGLEALVFVLDRNVMFRCHFAGRLCLCFIMLPACVHLTLHFSERWQDFLQHGVFTLLNPHLVLCALLLVRFSLFADNARCQTQ